MNTCHKLNDPFDSGWIMNDLTWLNLPSTISWSVQPSSRDFDCFGHRPNAEALG